MAVVRKINLRDIELLKKSIDEGKNLCRSNFYLANTYKDTKNFRNAIAHYEYVIENQTWDEEIFISYLNMGKCLMEIGDTEQAITSWLNGYNVCPSRTETIYELIKFYRANKQYELCMLFYSFVRNTSLPNDKVLFINSEVYDGLLDYEFTVFGYYLLPRYPLLFMDVLATTKQLLMKENLSSMSSLLSNYKYYKRYTSIKGMGTVYNVGHDISGYNSSTPSIVKWLGDTYLLNQRLVNYKIVNKKDYVVKDGDGKIRTKNRWVILDKNFERLDSGMFNDTDDNEHKRIYGIEDVRLIMVGGNIYYSGTVQDPFTHRLLISINEYSHKESAITKRLTFHPKNNNCEKNWVMYDYNGKIKIVYQWYPLTIGHIEGNHFVAEDVIETPEIFRHIRGSTNGVLIDNTVCFIVHMISLDNDVRHYYHCFVVMDKDKKRFIDISLPFTFSIDNNIEYCLGLLVEGDDIIMTYSLNDSCSKIIKIPLSDFKKRVMLN